MSAHDTHGWLMPKEALPAGRYALDQHGRLFPAKHAAIIGAVAMVRVTCKPVALPVPEVAIAPSEATPNPYRRYAASMRERATRAPRPAKRLLTCRVCGDEGPRNPCEYCRAVERAG